MSLGKALSEGLYVGQRVGEWFEEVCSLVPQQRRRELTGQTPLRWASDAAKGAEKVNELRQLARRRRGVLLIAARA